MTARLITHHWQANYKAVLWQRKAQATEAQAIEVWFCDIALCSA